MTSTLGAGVRFAFLASIAIFFALPIIVVAGVSFNNSSQMLFPPQDWSWRWYIEFFTNPNWYEPLYRSIWIALASAALSTSIALPIAYVQWRSQTWLSKLFAGLGMLPFVIPSVVVAIVFLLFWGAIKHVGQYENIVVSHAITFIAIPLMMISLGFTSIDKAFVEAAQTMGAPDEYVFHSVVLPIVLPFIISGAFFVMIFSLNEYMVAYMVGGFSVQTLPVKIFTNMRTGFSPAMCVAAVVFLGIGISAFLAIARFGNLPKLLGAKD